MIIRVFYSFLTLLILFSCGVRQKSDQYAFQLKDNSGKTVLEVDDAKQVFLLGKWVGSMNENGQLLNVQNRLIVGLGDDGFVKDADHKVLFKLAEDGRVQNDGGTIVEWNEKGRLQFDSDSYVDISPNKPHLYKTASLLMFAYLTASQNFTIEHNPIAQDPAVYLSNEKHFPRIEVYRVQNYGDTSNQTLELGDVGDKIQLNRALYSPYLERLTYYFNSKTDPVFLQLLSIPMNFLPEFKEDKKTITLKKYFDAFANESTKATLFPTDLNSYLRAAEKEKEKYRSIISFRNPDTVTVIWLDENNWFVDHVFYSIDLYPIEEKLGIATVDKQLAKGDMNSFIRYSYIIRPKLTEGGAILDANLGLEYNNEDEIITKIQGTDQLQNGRPYDYTLYADGRVHFIDSGTNQDFYYQLTHYQVVMVRDMIDHLNSDFFLKEYKAPRVVEGQNNLILINKHGKQYQLNYQPGDEIPAVVLNFRNSVLDLLAQMQTFEDYN